MSTYNLERIISLACDYETEEARPPGNYPLKNKKDIARKIIDKFFELDEKEKYELRDSAHMGTIDKCLSYG